MAKLENLKIKISGAADSATGTQSGNQDLGKRRAKFIAKALINTRDKEREEQKRLSAA